MKKRLLIPFLLLFIVTAIAQKSEKLSVRYITYSDKMKYYLMVKEWMESVAFLLEIDGRTSDFETIKKPNLWYEKPNPAQATMDLTRYYTDSISFVEQRTSFDQLYLIEGPSNQIKWELTNETKSILGYTSYKATYTKIEMGKPIPIEAWYAPELPYNFGPMEYHGLPGLILEIIRKEMLHYTASEINLNNEDVWILKPTSGEKIKRDVLNKKYEIAISEKLSEDN